jgi:hypothetical protein
MAILNRFASDTLILYPRNLNTFEQCREQYKLQHIDKLRVRTGFKRELERGIATHAALARCLNQIRQTNSVTADLQKIARSTLKRAKYPDSKTWLEDVNTVAHLTKIGLSLLPEEAHILAIEETLEYPFRGDDKCQPFILAAKVDVIYVDADGSLTHLDWKTGTNGQVDDIQNNVTRLLVGVRYKRAPVHSSTAYLSSGMMHTSILDRDEVMDTWAKVQDIAHEIQTTKDWHPTRNPLCPWCRFYTDGCTLNPNRQNTSNAPTWIQAAM